MAILYRFKDCLPWSVMKSQSGLCQEGILGSTFRIQLAQPLMCVCEDPVSSFHTEEAEEKLGYVIPHWSVGPENSLH